MEAAFCPLSPTGKGSFMTVPNRRRGFTLIELLVVLPLTPNPSPARGEGGKMKLRRAR